MLERDDNVNRVPVRRALLSVWDKTGLVDLARALVDAGAEIVSSGGTASALREAGIQVRDVSEVTAFPEMLDGRVKTLHPKLHGGILADRSKPEHMETIREHSIEPIDLVVCNLYPFDATGVELIDVGGPSMVRAAEAVATLSREIADVRVEVRASNTRTIQWILGVTIPLWIGTWGMMAAILLRSA